MYICIYVYMYSIYNSYTWSLSGIVHCCVRCLLSRGALKFHIDCITCIFNLHLHVMRAIYFQHAIEAHDPKSTANPSQIEPRHK